MNDVLQSAPFLLLFLGFLAAIYVAISYNVRTYKLQRRIQHLARSQGAEWGMWGDLEKMTAFVVKPDDLVLPAGDSEMLAAHHALLAHRQSMIRTAVKAGSFLVAGFISFVVVKLAMPG